MSMPPAKLLVSVSERMVIVKIQGRANVAASVDFKRLLNELIEKGFTCFVLDLSACLLMDSTFLGVLSGFGLKLKTPHNGQPAGHPIELLNPNVRIAELLDNLGVAHLFNIRNGAPDADASRGGETFPHTAAPASREEVTRNCLEAHKTLMKIDPANVARFKDVAQFLAEDLERIKSGE